MNIKNSSKSYLRKVVISTKNRLIQFSVGQTTQRKEISRNFLWSNFHTKLEKTFSHAGQPAKKRKMCRSTLVSLAFLLFFTSLCIVSLLGRQPLASATAAHSSSVTLHHSASASLDITPINCADIKNVSSNNCFGGNSPAEPSNHLGELRLGTSSCRQLTAVFGSICWNTNDFVWGTRDASCLENPSLVEPEFQLFLSTTYNIAPTATPTSNNVTPTATPASNNARPKLDTTADRLYNQDTCVDGSTCYSNNASGNDFNPVDSKGTLQIHAQIGGDNLICYNNACAGGLNAGKPTNETGPTSLCGADLPYNKFACMTANPSGTASGVWYINPTAYNPHGFLEEAFADWSGGWPFQTDGSGSAPTCNSEGQWICPSAQNVTILTIDSEVSFTSFGAGNTSPFSHMVSALAGRIFPTNTSYPPAYAVFCSANGHGIFPCSDGPDGQLNLGLIKQDWLSGDIGAAAGSGHLIGVLLSDTVENDHLKSLFSDTLAVGYLLIAPVFVLLGYQLLYSSWTFRFANMLETFPRMLLGIMAVSVSFELATMLIKVVDIFNIAVVTLHSSPAMAYPKVQIGTHQYAYALEGESPNSFRAIVVPVSRWGCVLNDFMKILGIKLLTDMSGFLPFVGGFLKLAGGIYDAVDVFRHIGEFLLLILSINLCTQIFVRVILINYYIVTGPIVFACWAFPAGIGQSVVSQWTKGFLSLLFVQTVQLFILTTLPVLVPTFPPLPIDRFGVVNTFFEQLPRVIVLMATVQAPKMMGTGATKAMAQAGTVASGAVVAVGAMAYNVV